MDSKAFDVPDCYIIKDYKYNDELAKKFKESMKTPQPVLSFDNTDQEELVILREMNKLIEVELTLDSPQWSQKLIDKMSQYKELTEGKDA